MRKITITLMFGLIFLVALVGCGPKPPPAMPPASQTVNQTPIAYPPFTTTMDFSSGSRVDYDLRYRLHGCDTSGAPTGVTGARDPDGDELEYRVDCKWTVFNQMRQKINGEWRTFPKDDRGEQVAIVTLFIGWRGDAPPYQFGSKCLLGERASGCQPILESVPFTYFVRDNRGGVASHTVILK